MNTYSNIMLDYSPPQLFIKIIFIHANKLKDTFLDLITFFHVCFILIFMCMDLLLSYLKRNCRYCDASLLFQHASPKNKYVLLCNHIITAKMFPVVPKIAVFFSKPRSHSHALYLVIMSFQSLLILNNHSIFFFLSEKFRLVVL